MNILPKRPPQQPAGPLALTIFDYDTELRRMSDDIAALDARVEANRARQVEIDKQLNGGLQPPDAAAPTTHIEAARRLLHPSEADAGPVKQTAAQLALALREEFTRLRDEIDLLLSARIDMVSRINHEREKAAARRLKEDDATVQQTELQTAARVLLDVHQRGLAMAGELNALGFPVREPFYFSGLHLPSALVSLLERAVAGREATLPEPPPRYVGPPVEKIEQRSFIRSASSF